MDAMLHERTRRTTRASHTDLRLNAKSAKHVAMVLHDAAIFDDRQLVLHGLLLGFAAPGARLKPYGSALRRRLSDVYDARIRPTEDHHHIDRSRHILELAVGGQIDNRHAIRPYWHDIVATLVE